ncbi:MAG: protein phosphatase 2C domain-containing protein [Woeseiaceae bacterium]|nr:protein phosphatase 2C domain-containing protein [Woeseiaceae bacterium]
MMPEMPSDTTLLDGAVEPDFRTVALAGGTLVAHTCRAPDKQTENEDTVAAIPYGDDAAVLIVADGAGGLPAGRRASLTAVTELQRAVDEAQREDMLLRTAILNGIEAANQALLDSGSGSATTLTVMGITGHEARFYQIGDSEALIVGQRGRLRSQTMAHSPTGFAVEAGFLDKRAALHHEERHLVSNFLGTPDMRVDMGSAVTLQSRDTIMLASDGLTDNVHLHEIIEIIRKGPLETAVTTLVRLASRRMTAETLTQPSKPDDLSVILYRKPKKRAASRASGPRERQPDRDA